MNAQTATTLPAPAAAPDAPEAGRPRLLHFHQFKNGGSTLDWILKRNFGARFTEFHGEGELSALKAPEIAGMLDALPGFDAYSSHHFRPPLPGRDGLAALWLIRHPLDRVPSVYEQERRSAPGGPDAAGFPAFADWFEQTRHERPFVFCDAQVALVGNSGDYEEAPTEATLRAAMRELQRAPFVGVVDDYDRSMIVLEALLRRWWPGFDACYRTQNHSNREAAMGERLLVLCRRLGEANVRRLAELNRLDLALYRFARLLLARSLARLDDVPGRLQDFQERCRALPPEED